MVLEKKKYNRVLVVDDDHASLYLARMVLEEVEVAEEIATVPSAYKGLDYIKAHCINEHAAKDECPDLILLDINMPGINGFEFLDNLQALEQQNLINRVVVALTSSNVPRDRSRMQNYGVQHFVVKPITEEKIVELVAKRG